MAAARPGTNNSTVYNHSAEETMSKPVLVVIDVLNADFEGGALSLWNA